ncbi:hypothetical protein [Bradyrhizobium sp. LTSP857]|uniref:hypothetical protein n=1 Tax=Bradyrhizobium sp. LTSP857 TaxID=1619231 RepID=UPI001FDAAE2C|nr:hypothetical protein [Bradyrhizobium sp. LTSP857]
MTTADPGWTTSRERQRSPRRGQLNNTDVPQLAQAKSGDTEELRQAIAHEQQKVQALARDLRTSRQDLESVLKLLEQARQQWISIAEAAETETGRLQKSLQEERARGQRLEQDLTIARRDLELQAGLTPGADDNRSELKHAAERDLRELKDVAQRERDRASRLEQDLAAARRELETQVTLAARAAAAISAKEAAEKALTELQTNFQQEHERAKHLEEDLGKTRSELDKRSLQIARANEETTQIKLAADNSLAKVKLSLKEDREKAEGLVQELSRARARLFAYEAQAAANDDKANESQELLRHERDRSSRLEEELAGVRRAPESRSAAGKPGEDAAGTPSRRDLPWAGLLRLPQQPQSLGELAATSDKTKTAPTDPAVVTTGEIEREPFIEGQTVRPLAGAGDTLLEHDYAAELMRLTARATGLLRQGDIGAARAVLERAAELGSAQAAFALAETFDPNVLAKWGAYGMRGDPIKARELYAKAEAGGIKEAKERFDAVSR